MKNQNFLIPFLYILICLFWGTSWLVIKISLNYVTPFINLGLRFLISALAIYLIMIYTKTELDLSRKSVSIYILLGLFSYSIPFSFVYWAEKTIPSSLASILFGMYPLFVALISSLFCHEEVLTSNRIVGILVSFFGLILIFKDGLKIELSQYLSGMIAVVTSALMQASSAVMIKKKGRHLNPLSMNFIPALLAGSILILLGIFKENLLANNFNLKSILMILYLAIFVTVFNFTSYYWLLKRISVIILSLTSFITPVIAVLVGVLIGGEKLSRNIVSGAIFVLFGIIIVNWEGIKKIYHQKKVKSL